jgi:hypothetical protein
MAIAGLDLTVRALRIPLVLTTDGPKPQKAKGGVTGEQG